MQTPSTIPREIETPRHELAYRYLDLVGDATLEEIAAYLGATERDVLTVLRELRDDGVVTETYGFWVPTR